MAFMTIENERVAALGRARNRHWFRAFQGETGQEMESSMRTLQFSHQEVGLGVIKPSSGFFIPRCP